ncbi:MAG TPA: HAD-IIA family hydrolase [Candidatus Gallimonas intestinavium]|uniref:Acid sugar phosphatase n=1 Tax=Candidatus Gallimonas intestinavium TaxID=2838603 RepID=A0A9D2K0Y4_9FIRM|nr:HAD-IIA family hydrolase [Candidatus Gallimonas intestinavium]
MTKETLLKETDAFLFDLDGTVYLDETPIGDVKGTLARLRAMHKRIVFLTNNSSKTEAEYRQKLTRIGLWGEGDLVYTSAMATAEHVAARFPHKRVYLLATDAVKEEFSRTVPLVEEAPDVVILAYDTTLTFAKMKRFNEFLAGGAVFLATHPDAVCPTAGVSMPDVGAFLELFYTSSGRRPDLIVGKPGTAMGEGLERRLGIPRARMCMTGDRMHTDIRFGNNCGMHTVLVLSGETTEETMKNFPDRPDLVLPDVNALV